MIPARRAPAVLLLALAAAASPPAHRSPLPVTAEILVGRWGDNGDCSRFLILRGDGSFRSYTGGEGRWSFRRGMLTMSGAGGTVARRVERTDAAHIRLTAPGGTGGVSQRCPSPR